MLFYTLEESPDRFCSVLQFLQSIGAQLELYNPYVVKPQRENDKHIMTEVIKSGKFAPCDIRRVNYCRMYLNVVLLSDITNAGGTAIDDAMYRGNPTNTISTSPDHQVEQVRPNAKAWTQWRRALQLFCRRNRGHKNLKHQHRLGQWLTAVNCSRRKWPAYYDPQTNQMYRPTQSGFTLHNMMIHDFDLDAATTVNTLPATAVPCDVLVRTGSLSRLGYSRVKPEVIPSTASYQELVATMEPWERHLFDTMDWLVSEEEVWEALCEVSCLLVSDGSAPCPQASFGWVLSRPDGTRLVKCSGPAFGLKVSAHRAEGYGLLSGYRFLHHMQQRHDDPQNMKPTKISSDNETMVKTNVKYFDFDIVYPNSTLDAEWDIIAEIQDTAGKLHQDTQPTLTHIKGHQDEEVEYDKLSLTAQLNVDADGLASAWLQANPHWEHEIVPILPTCGSQIHLPEGTITRRLKQELKLAVSTPAIKNTC